MIYSNCSENKAFIWDRLILCPDVFCDVRFHSTNRVVPFHHSAAFLRVFNLRTIFSHFLYSCSSLLTFPFFGRLFLWKIQEGLTFTDCSATCTKKSEWQQHCVKKRSESDVYDTSAGDLHVCFDWSWFVELVCRILERSCVWSTTLMNTCCQCGTATKEPSMQRSR